MHATNLLKAQQAQSYLTLERQTFCDRTFGFQLRRITENARAVFGSHRRANACPCCTQQWNRYLRLQKQLVSKLSKRIFSQILSQGNAGKPWQQKERDLTIEKIVQKMRVLVNETTVEVVKLMEDSVAVGFKLLLALKRIKRNSTWHPKIKEVYRI